MGVCGCVWVGGWVGGWFRQKIMPHCLQLKVFPVGHHNHISLYNIELSILLPQSRAVVYSLEWWGIKTNHIVKTITAHTAYSVN